MSWSETKKINSDLNKPLNELIREQTEKINNNPDLPLNELIRTLLSSSGSGEKAYTPSDNLLEDVLDNELTLGTIGTTPSSGRSLLVGRWIPKCSGTVGIQMTCRAGMVNGNETVRGGYVIANNGAAGNLYPSSTIVGAVVASSPSDTWGCNYFAGSCSKEYVTYRCTRVVKKGDPVMFLIYENYTAYSSATQLPACNSIKIYADEVS